MHLYLERPSNYVRQMFWLLHAVRAIRMLKASPSQACMQSFSEVFDEEKAAELPPIDGPRHAIKLKAGVALL